MIRVTKRIKKNKEVFKGWQEEDYWNEKLAEVIVRGKKALDEICGEIGRIRAEIIMIMEREEISRKDYQPVNRDLQKWGFQKGSGYVGKQKIRVHHPRLRFEDKEVPLKSCDQLKRSNQFSEEMLANALRELSGRKYKETIEELANGFGISASGISNRFVEASYAKLKEFQERDLSDFKAFAIFLGTVHRGGAAFTIALGIDIKSQKKAPGLWEGATENREIAKSLLSDLRSRGLKLSGKIIFVADGGGRIIRALKDLLRIMRRAIFANTNSV